MPKPKRQRRTPAEIQEILSDLEKGGLSRREFAFSRNIPLSTVHAWVRKHRPVIGRDLPDVIPVGTFPEAATAIEIELRGGEILRLCRGFHVEDLRTILLELRRC